MKRFFLLLTFIGALFVVPKGFTQSTKSKQVTLKYEDGSKYIGTILIQKINGKKEKYRHGDGVLYYANGNSFDGSWNNDSPLYGTYRYANGNCFKGSLENDTPVKGQFIFARKGSIELGDKIWEYPARCSFNGEFKSEKPYTGQFDCPLTTTTGDQFTGTIKSGKLDKGTIVFANGDIFQGTFYYSAPSNGKYRYGGITEVTKANHKWIVPAGCTFDGRVQALTGTVDMKITDDNGNQFIGKLAAGQPDEGTMIFANGTTETGKWHYGMSPSKYKTYLAKQKAEQKRQKAIKDSKDLREFEKYVQNKIRDCYGFSFDIWHPISNGAYLKLKQLYLKKTIISNKTSKKYLCIDMQYQCGVIEITIKSQEGEIYKLYIRRIEISKRPSIKIDRVYPDDWPYVYYTLSSVVDTKEKVKNTGGDFWIGSASFYLADDNYEQTINRLRNCWSRKFGSYWASIIINKEFKLGMTVEMVEAIKGKGDISRDISANGEIIYLSYGYTTYFVFVNGKLRNYTIDE